MSVGEYRVFPRIVLSFETLVRAGESIDSLYLALHFVPELLAMNEQVFLAVEVRVTGLDLHQCPPLGREGS